MWGCSNQEKKYPARKFYPKLYSSGEDFPYMVIIISFMVI